jgi:hypothetical protein
MSVRSMSPDLSARLRAVECPLSSRVMKRVFGVPVVRKVAL